MKCERIAVTHGDTTYYFTVKMQMTGNSLGVSLKLEAIIFPSTAIELTAKYFNIPA